jgi:fructose-1,6-bisphosphatase I
MSNQPLQTLGEFLIDKQDDFQYSTGEFSRLLSAIRLASKVVNREVNKAGIVDITGAAGNQNVQGEEQQKLDVIANEIFITALSQRELFVVLLLKKMTILLILNVEKTDI